MMQDKEYLYLLSRLYNQNLICDIRILMADKKLVDILISDSAALELYIASMGLVGAALIKGREEGLSKEDRERMLDNIKKNATWIEQQCENVSEIPRLWEGEHDADEI